MYISTNGNLVHSIMHIWHTNQLGLAVHPKANKKNWFVTQITKS